MQQKNGDFSWNWLMSIPVLGWIYIIFGLIYPLENTLLLIIWWIDVFLSVVVHTIQIVVAMPIGKKAGFIAGRIALYTFIFGATWWEPLREKYSGE